MKAEARKIGQGATKTMVDVNIGLVAHGWCDGNPVPLLTTADGTGSSSVTRRVHLQAGKKPALIALGSYNWFMHAVDWNDQLRN